MQVYKRVSYSVNTYIFSSSAHLKQLRIYSIIVPDQPISMSVLIVVALCVGVVSAVPGPSSMLGMSTSLCHMCYQQLYSCLMSSLLTPAPLNPLEHSEHTIPEEYIVVFKQDASETQGACVYP